MKNKKFQWNISLLVILILLSTSIMSLLSINQIQHLMTYWNQTYNYFRAYYLAKAWNEVWLTELYHHEDGFESSIEKWDSIISYNFLWETSEEYPEWKYSWFEPYFTMNISGKFNYITNDPRAADNCNEENKITLQKWEWIMLALFSDNTTKKTVKNLLTDVTIDNLENYANINWISFNPNLSNSVTFWLFDEEFSNIHVRNGNNLSNNKYNKNIKKPFLTIKNNNESISFCIQWENLASPDSLITSIWHYWNIEVWLQTVIKKRIPSWTLDVLGMNTTN